MAAVAVIPGNPDGIHIPDGRGVLVEADEEIGAARYGAAPEGHEVESPERVARGAVETRAVNREHAPDARIDVRDELVRNGYLYRPW